MEGTSRLRWAAVTAIAPVAWGSTYVVTREVLPADHPLWGAALRALPAGVLLVLLARRLPTGAWWWRSLVLGVLNVGAFFVLVYVAAQTLPASTASVLMALSSVTLTLLAWPLVGERPTARGLACAVVGVLGVWVVLGAASDGSVGGVLASVTAMLSSSVGFLLARRWGSDVPLAALTGWQLVAGGLAVLAVAVVVEGAPPVATPTVVGGFAYLTLVATLVAYLAWFAGLRRLPASTVGVVGLLNPLTGVALGVLVAHESFGAAQALGAAMVVGAVAASVRRRPLSAARANMCSCPPRGRSSTPTSTRSTPPSSSATTPRCEVGR